MFKFDQNSIKKLERDLSAFSKRAVPFAMQQTLNMAAKEGAFLLKENIQQKMVLRNKFTERGVRSTRAKGLNLRTMQSTFGSVTPYMAIQESGGTKMPTGKEGVAIPTTTASGEAKKARVRKKVVRRPNRKANIQLGKNRKQGSSKRQRNTAAIQEARESGRRLVYLDLGATKGIFRVKGGKRRTKILMLHDLSRSSVRVPKKPTLKPATEEVIKKLPKIYRFQLGLQIERRKLFVASKNR